MLRFKFELYFQNSCAVGAAVRGWSVAHLYIDEASVTKPNRTKIWMVCNALLLSAFELL